MAHFVFTSTRRPAGLRQAMPFTRAVAMSVATAATLALLGLLASSASAQAASPSPQAAPGTATATSSGSCAPLLNKRFPRLQDGVPQDLCQYSRKVLLVVNTASYCGFTPQYEGLEQLYAQLQPKGLVILGFPSNDFGQQEPGNSQQIADLCFNTYGVKFPMFEKSEVRGPQANALYRELAQATGKSPLWNFHKYLIDRQGKVVGSYSSLTDPQDKRLLADIERSLAAP